MATIVTQPQWKSKVLWATLLAQVISILVLTGVIDTGLGATVNAVIGTVLELFVSFGLLNSPINKNGL